MAAAEVEGDWPGWAVRILQPNEDDGLSTSCGWEADSDDGDSVATMATSSQQLRLQLIVSTASQSARLQLLEHPERVLWQFDLSESTRYTSCRRTLVVQLIDDTVSSSSLSSQLALLAFVCPRVFQSVDSVFRSCLTNRLHATSVESFGIVPRSLPPPPPSGLLAANQAFTAPILSMPPPSSSATLSQSAAVQSSQVVSSGSATAAVRPQPRTAALLITPPPRATVSGGTKSWLSPFASLESKVRSASAPRQPPPSLQQQSHCYENAPSPVKPQRRDQTVAVEPSGGSAESAFKKAYLRKPVHHNSAGAPGAAATTTTTTASSSRSTWTNHFHRSEPVKVTSTSSFPQENSGSAADSDAAATATQSVEVAEKGHHRSASAKDSKSIAKYQSSSYQQQQHSRKKLQKQSQRDEESDQEQRYVDFPPRSQKQQHQQQPTRDSSGKFLLWMRRAVIRVGKSGSTKVHSKDPNLANLATATTTTIVTDPFASATDEFDPVLKPPASAPATIKSVPSSQPQTAENS